MKSSKQFIEIQNGILEHHYDEMLEDLIDDLDYFPGPPNHFHPEPTEKEIKEELHEELKAMIVMEKKRERCLDGVQTIFELIGTLPRGQLCLQELLAGGELLFNKITSDEEKDANDPFSDETMLGLVPDETNLYEKLGISFETLATVYQLGNQLFAEEKFEEAAGVYEVLGLLNQTSPTIWTAAGLCHYRLKNWGAAVESFLAASDANAEDPVPLMHCAFCYLAMNDHEKAKEMIEAAQQLIDEGKGDSSSRPSYLATLDELVQRAA